MSNVVAKINLLMEAGKAVPGPKIASVLGPRGIPVPKFCEAFNKATSAANASYKVGDLVTVRISIKDDRSHDFTVSGPPVAYLLKQEAKLSKASGNSGKELVAKLSMSAIIKVAKCKMVDMKVDNEDSAVKMVIGTAKSMGIEVVEVNLGVDSRKSEEQVRGTVVLPKGIGKNIKVAVFAQDKHLLEAEKAGADITGGEDLIEEIKKGRKLNVDWCITTPDFMAKITPIAKVLGAKGLMPNPKFGTVTSNIAEATKTIKSGQIKFRTDKNGVIHGKFSGSVAIIYSSAIVEAAKLIVDFINANKEKMSVICAAHINELLTVEDVNKLAKLPSLDELRVKIMRLISYDIPARLALSINSSSMRLMRVLDYYSSKK
ncbi:jg12662 [Pararge aegeria aegeria]|uniref:Large ribosomal subunit protein uL11 n=1 Tax=Pararge aegeria aegeria TaxID=348720 RepID=A0A8S4QLP5_9NEOP|nr:jg12662 [Pararge aegeria aegeria]